MEGRGLAVDYRQEIAKDSLQAMAATEWTSKQVAEDWNTGFRLDQASVRVSEAKEEASSTTTKIRRDPGSTQFEVASLPLCF